MLIADTYEFPDTCPTDCHFSDDFMQHGQGSICTRCPVFNCGGEDAMLPPGEYRADWAKEFHAVVVGGEKRFPALPLQPSGSQVDGTGN